jgi:signal transduction histidine kinase
MINTANSPASIHRVTIPANVISKDISTQFSLILAHEIRNPLNNISLCVEVLETEIKDERMAIYLDILRRNAARINHLVDTLLRYRQEEEATVEKQSIHKLIDDVLLMAADKISLRDISVIKNYDEYDCIIAVNRQKVMIALTNIIGNSIDAMTRGKGVLKIVTTSTKTGCTLRIEDNGCGISKINLRNIFKPFFTNKPGGLGFGLAATYGILHANHIGVHVQSEEGTGTQFSLLFNKDFMIPAVNICLP